ncbi:putative F-box domain-containing protein [Helianthus anomalus]
MEDLPSNIMVDILSRLTVKTIIHCRCVCKNWRNIVSESHFANIHLSRSPAGVLKWVEISDEDHHLLHDPVMSLDLSLAPVFQNVKIQQVGSVNGLLCLWEFGPEGDNTFICNPITREYMILPRQNYYREGYAIIVYGFGVGLQTKEYKVIRTFQGDIPPNQYGTSRPSLLEAEDAPEKLCTFDFDKETFQLFPSPPSEAIEDSSIHFQSLAVLNGCLSQSYTYDSQIKIWVMKEYGINNSWRKEVVIKQSISPDLDWLMWVLFGIENELI